MNKYRPLILLAIVWIQILMVWTRRECAHRDYGRGSTVCVCNSTYCDDLEPINRTVRGLVTKFETSKTGDRLRKTEFKFGQNAVNSNATQKQTITLNRHLTYQKIIGFGGCFTPPTGRYIARLEPQMQSTLIEDYFSERGIEYTIGRIPIEINAEITYHNYSGDFNLSQFSLPIADLLYKIPYLKLAEQLSPHKPKWFASTWSPPPWLKSTGTFDNGGVLIGEPGGKYYQTFAEFFVKFLDAYKHNSVNIWGVTVTNEPDNGFKHLGKGRFEDLGLTPELERDFIKLNLGPTLTRAGYGRDKLELMIFDGEMRARVFEWTDTIMSDSEAAKYVTGVAFHWYRNSPENIATLDETYEKYPQLFLMSTEACEGSSDAEAGVGERISMGNWTRFETYSFDIITDLNHCTTGWVDWNMVLEETYPYEDAPIIVNSTAKEYYKQPMFYSLAHFSKFLLPNSVRIDVTVEPRVNKLETTAFVRPDNATVLIALNLSDDSVMLTVVDESNGNFTDALQPRSLQTYIWFD